MSASREMRALAQSIELAARAVESQALRIEELEGALSTLILAIRTSGTSYDSTLGKAATAAQVELPVRSL